MATDRREYNKQYYLTNLEKERQRKREYYRANKDKLDREALREKGRAYYQANKGKWQLTREQKDRANERERKKRAESTEERVKHRAEVRQWQKDNPEKRKAARLKPYGITLDEFNRLLEEQGRRCAICGFSDTTNPRMFPVVDHCHNHNHVRGILCSNCNQALGKMKDSPELLRAAALYLER